MSYVDKSPTTFRQPGIHLLVLSHNLCYCTTKVLLFSRLVYHPADNYQSKSDDNPECPSAQLQLHLLPAGELLLYRVRLTDSVCPVNIHGVVHNLVTVHVLVPLHPYGVSLLTYVDAVMPVDAVSLHLVYVDTICFNSLDRYILHTPA